MFLDTAGDVVLLLVVIMTSGLGCSDSLFGESEAHRTGAWSSKKTGVIIRLCRSSCKRKVGK